MKTVASPPPLVCKADKALAAHAKRFNASHAVCLKDNRSALHRAHDTGTELALAQKEVYATRGHEWLAYLAQYADFDRFRAAEYLRIAENWERIEAECARCEHMGYREALNFISGDKNTPELEDWETPSPVSDTPTVVAAGQNIDTLIAALPPAEQCEVLERNAERLEVQEQASARRAGEDGQRSLPGRIEQACKKPERLLGQWDGDRALCLGLLHALLSVVKGEGLTVKQATALEVFREGLAA